MRVKAQTDAQRVHKAMQTTSRPRGVGALGTGRLLALRVLCAVASARRRSAVAPAHGWPLRIRHCVRLLPPQGGAAPLPARHGRQATLRWARGRRPRARGAGAPFPFPFGDVVEHAIGARRALYVCVVIGIL